MYRITKQKKERYENLLTFQVSLEDELSRFTNKFDENNMDDWGFFVECESPQMLAISQKNRKRMQIKVQVQQPNLRRSHHSHQFNLAELALLNDEDKKKSKTWDASELTSSLTLQQFSHPKVVLKKKAGILLKQQSRRLFIRLWQERHIILEDFVLYDQTANESLRISGKTQVQIRVACLEIVSGVSSQSPWLLKCPCRHSLEVWCHAIQQVIDSAGQFYQQQLQPEEVPVCLERGKRTRKHCSVTPPMEIFPGHLRNKEHLRPALPPSPAETRAPRHGAVQQKLIKPKWIQPNYKFADMDRVQQNDDQPQQIYI